MRYDMKELASIHGVIPAMLTCFDDEGKFDADRQRTLTRFLLSKQVDALYLTGSTGETFLMTERMRKACVETVIDEVAGRIPVIVHVGDIGTDKSINFARHAQAAGADAISSVPPFYWKFSTDEIYQYYKDVSESVGIPMIVYNIALAGLVDFNTVKRLASIENVKGIKYTASTHYEILKIKREIGRDFAVYSGCDEMAMSGMSYGADGIIGSFYNVVPELFVNIVQAERTGDMELCRQLQTQADAVISFVLEHHFFDCMKRMLTWAGHDAGTVLRPFHKMTEKEQLVARNGLRELRDSYRITGCEVLDRL